MLKFALATALLVAIPACGNETAPMNNDSGVDPTGDGGQTVDLCEFSPAEPQWVVEGESLVVSISCATGAELSDLVLGELPIGAGFDEESLTLTWTPGWDQAAVYELPLSSETLLASGALTIGVADAFGNADNLPIVDPSKYTMELGLPVLFMSAEPPNNDDFVPTQITYGGVVHEAEAKLRGKSSLSYPKKSYALRFDKFNAFNERGFADFANRTRVILTSTFDDNSYIRQRMAFDLWSLLEPSIPITAYSAVVYHGTEYRGIYTVTDHVNASHLARNNLSDDANLFKAENHAANFRADYDGSPKSTLSLGYSKTEGDPKEGEDGAFADLEELVDFVANTDDTTFNTGIAEHIDVDDYTAWWIHVTFILAQDSAGKNSYHYHDEVRTWRVAPWDFNDSFGQSWTTRRVDSDEFEDFFSRNGLFERLLGHPTIGPAIRLRYKALLETGVFSKATLLSMIDRYEDEIHLSAQRDWALWEDQYQNFSRWDGRGDFTSHEEELQYIRTWLTERWQFSLDTYAAGP